MRVLSRHTVAGLVAFAGTGCVAPVKVSPNFDAARSTIATVAVLPPDVRLVNLLGVVNDPAEPSTIAVAIHPQVVEELRMRGFEVRDTTTLDAGHVATAMNEFLLAGTGAGNLSPNTRKHRDALSRLSPGLATAAGVDAIVYVRVGGYFSDRRQQGGTKPGMTLQTLEIALVDGRTGEILWAGTSSNWRADGKTVTAGLKTFPLAASPTPRIETAPTPAVLGTSGAFVSVADEAAAPLVVDTAAAPTSSPSPSPEPTPSDSWAGRADERRAHRMRATFEVGGSSAHHDTEDNYRIPAPGVLMHASFRAGAEAPDSRGLYFVVEGTAVRQFLGEARCRPDAEPCAGDASTGGSRTLGLMAARIGADTRLFGMDIGGAVLAHPDLDDPRLHDGPTGIYPTWSTTYWVGPSAIYTWFSLYAGRWSGLEIVPDADEVFALGIGHRSRAFSARIGGGNGGLQTEISFPLGPDLRVGFTAWAVESGDWAAVTGFTFPIGKGRRVAPIYGGGTK